MSRWVAAIEPNINLDRLVLPSRSNSRSWKARNNFGCNSMLMSPISSKNKLPWSADLETALFLHQRAGKGALLVPEEFAFQQPRWNRGAIQPHESPLPPRAAAVNSSCDQLLPGSRLAMEQHRGVGRRNDGDLLQHF